MYKKNKRKIILARNIGFCSGVSRAVALSEKLAKKYEIVYTLDEILHNESEMARLKKRGIRIVGKNSKGKAVLLPAHGASKDEINKLKIDFENVVDATCPLVLRTVRLIHELVKDGYGIAVVGDKGHRETRVLAETAEDSLFGIFESREDVAKDSHYSKLAMVSQSTVTEDRFFSIAEILAKHTYELRIFNTICDETLKRQKEATDIAGIADCIIVIGGKKSANTKRLFEKVEAINPNAFFISSEKDLESFDISNCRNIGVTSGTSTPSWLIERIVSIINKKEGR